MNVPTLAWNPEHLQVGSYVYKTVSSCPYLTPDAGATWKTSDELMGWLDRIESDQVHFKPRAWVLENMTDAIAATQFINLVNKVRLKTHDHEALHGSA